MSSSLLVSKRPIKGRQIARKAEPTIDFSDVIVDDNTSNSNNNIINIEDPEYNMLLELNKKYNTSGIVQPPTTTLSNDMSMPIDGLQFSMLTPKDIKGISVLEVTNFLMEGPNSIHDPRLGPIGNGRDNRCITCNGVYKRGTGDPNEIECPGHWSYIELMIPIPHPLCTKEILTYLRLFCNIEGCGRLLFTLDQIRLLNLPKGLAARLTKLSEYREQLKVCGHCEKNQPKITSEDNKFFIQYKENEQPLSYERISNIFDNIVPEDLELLGVDPELTHPSYFLIKCFPVLPPCVRNFVVSGDGNVGHDDLSYKYTDIVKLNNELRKSSSETRTEELLTMLSNTIFYMMDNSKGKAKDNSGHRAIRCLKQRLEGKHGHVRSTQGKRVDYCGRTVITGDANCDVDELIVPTSFAEKLTIPVHVNSINIKECQDMLDNDQVVYIIRGKRRTNAKLALYTKSTSFGNCDTLIRNGNVFTYEEIMEIQRTKGWTFLPTDEIVRPNGRREVYTLSERIPFRLQINDVIERKIRNGDTVIFNRQPTLWKGSMRSKRISIREGKTLRFNVASTQPFNADYDGDEMNMHVCQSLPTISESKNIISTVENFNSSQDSKPMIGFKLDAMVGGYLLTYGVIRIPKWLFWDIMEKLDRTYVDNKIKHIKKVLEWKMVLTDSDFNTNEEIKELVASLDKEISGLEEIKALYDKAKGKEIPPLFKKLEKAKSSVALMKQNVELAVKKYKDDHIENLLYTGHNLISIFLPDDFEYTIQNDKSPDGKAVVITRGVLLSGTLDKTAMGSSSGSLIHHLSKDYSNQRACQFISEYSRMINIWLMQQGFSVGIYDCLATDTQVINDEVNKNLLKAKAAIDGEKDPELRETNIKIALNDVSAISRKIAQKGLQPDNRMLKMVESGAKGSAFNLTQITGMVGQQNVGMDRIEKQFGGRTLPHFEEHIEDIRTEFASRGFIFSSYFHGMNPTETFFAAAGGRQGLIDTAVKTAATGYIQRKMAKILEDLTASYVGTVNDGTQNIVQFNYGEDNLDASKLIKVGSKNDKGIFSFIDIRHTILKCNIDYEWKQYLNGISTDNINSKKRKLTKDEIHFIKDNIIAKVYEEFYTVNSNKECVQNAFSTLEPHIHNLEMYPEMIEYLYQEITRQLKQAIINSGESVGHVAASSMGEQNTQSSLNSFHSSGSFKQNLTSGLSRLEELMNATKNPKSKSLTIYFDTTKVNVTDYANIRSLTNIHLLSRSLNDYIKTTTIEVQPTLTPLEQVWYHTYQVFVARDDISNCKYRLRLQIDPNILYLSKRTLYSIAKSIETVFIKGLHFYVVCSPDYLGIIDIWVEDSISDPNTFFNAKGYEAELLLEHFVNNENKMYHLIKKIILPKIKKLHISGIEGIKEVFYDKNKQDEWYIQTKGGSLKCLYYNPLIDHYRSVSNDMWEVNTLFGIESSKKWLKEEFSQLLNVNHRHLDILVDKMTFAGTISAVSIYGLDRKLIGPLSKAVFERPVACLLTAAQKSEYDSLKSISSCVATGKLGRFGTGIVDLISDNVLIMNNPYAEQYAQQAEQLLYSGEELPAIEEDDEDVITIEEPLELNEDDIY